MIATCCDYVIERKRSPALCRVFAFLALGFCGGAVSVVGTKPVGGQVAVVGTKLAGGVVSVVGTIRRLCGAVAVWCAVVAVVRRCV